ncbi:MAG: TrkA family potassium uptake protein, partial [Deltaproteobacteria bacterium]|nr:TrkA family potassium uptake protein [Deltaproteobacteria bacterium]
MAKKRFAVIGAGSFGYHVAKALYENQNEVVAVDRNQERVQAVEPHCTSAVVQDVTDMEALKGLGLEEMDAVIVSTGANIKPSILICFHLSRLGIKRIIAKAEDDDHGEILKQLGATEIIRPGMDMAQRLALRLTSPNILEFLPLEEEYTIA